MKKYHQNEGSCPLLDDPWLYLAIGALGEGPQVEDSLDGTYGYPDNTNISIKTFLRHLQRTKIVSDKEPLTLMSLAAHRESWKIIKENKSSQGSQIGMYKSAEQHPLLGWIFHHNDEITYLSRYSLRRHRTCTNIMLPKKTDSWDVKDLRTTVLLESEANNTYKRIRIEASNAAIEHGKFSPESI